MIVAVASGKGGTGKTTVSTNLAFSSDNKVQLLDCDVEEPNAHIFIKPDIDDIRNVCVPVPEIIDEKCSLCGKCQDVCEYNAIAVIPSKGETKGKVLVFPELCHGCGACAYLCPEKCINEVPRPVGVLESGKKEHISFSHGKLNIGEAMAPPLIREVKKRIGHDTTVIIDAPPGTSCPVITSIEGTDFCILVTEPTPFGLNDLKLAVEVLKDMDIPFGVVVNRSDLGDGKTADYCRENEIPVLMEIPFDKNIAAAYSRGVPIVEEFPEYRDKFRELLSNIEGRIKK